MGEALGSILSLSVPPTIYHKITENVMKRTGERENIGGRESREKLSRVNCRRQNKCRNV